MEFFVEKGFPRERRFEVTLSRENQPIVKADSQTGRLVCLCLLCYEIETNVSMKSILWCSIYSHVAAPPTHCEFEHLGPGSRDTEPFQVRVVQTKGQQSAQAMRYSLPTKRAEPW